MILNDSTIQTLAESGLIEPFVLQHLNGHSYDVTLSDHFICPEGAEKHADELCLRPGRVVLASTAEKVCLPDNLAAYLSLKSSIARQWINHAMAGWIYPKFEGNITLELMNVGVKPFTLKAGMRIAQLTFLPAMMAAGKYVSSLPGTEGTVAVPKE